MTVTEFDRSDEITGLLLAAVERQASTAAVLESLRALLLGLLDQQHPISGVDQRSVTFFRNVAGSPTLIARARDSPHDDNPRERAAAQ